jgi:hypothetical protein
MAEENLGTAAENEMASDADAQLPAMVANTSAESGIIINIDQVQSIDISDRFTREKTAEGWSITLHEQAKVTINFTTSMRKIETVLVEGDVIERTSHDLILLRKHTSEAYRTQRATSSLARTREQLLQGRTGGDTTV